VSRNPFRSTRPQQASPQPADQGNPADDAIIDQAHAFYGILPLRAGETSGGYLSSRRELTMDISAAACVRMKRPVNSRMGGCRNAMFKSKRVKATG